MRTNEQVFHEESEHNGERYLVTASEWDIVSRGHVTSYRQIEKAEVWVEETGHWMKIPLKDLPPELR